jgi:Fe-S-cluster containining protein
MANLNFSCTQCGKCCHDLRLPLTRGEAVEWLTRGGTVELLCEAMPWLEEPDPSNLQALHKRRRSFPAMSGGLPIRVVVVLTAVYVGPCPNLGADMRCGIYESRPHVCRIYPVEINPFIALSPANKMCPPEAWTASTPLLRDGDIVDEETRLHIAQSRQEDELEAVFKGVVCTELGLGSAAVTNEGFTVHSPPADILLRALGQVRFDSAEVLPQWTMLSNQEKTVQALVKVGADAAFMSSAAVGATKYLGFRADALNAVG